MYDLVVGILTICLLASCPVEGTTRRVGQRFRSVLTSLLDSRPCKPQNIEVK